MLGHPVYDTALINIGGLSLLWSDEGVVGSKDGARPLFTPLGCPFSRCKDPDLVALLKLGLLTTPCHLLRLLDLLSSHV